VRHEAYDGLVPHPNQMNLDQFVLEYATPRAGSPRARDSPGAGTDRMRSGESATADVESLDEIVNRVRELTEVASSDRIFLNPNCGFGTSAERPVADGAHGIRKAQRSCSGRQKVAWKLTRP
jgi:5-methyltetrahydropteroyltriglutamate--homocysteine methyltransferase